jgi:drug/metabolite transporter (DMT)-like permease
VILNFASIIFFGLCWGVTVPLSKIAIEGGHHPLGLIAWQLFLSAIMLGVILVIKKQRVAYSSVALKYFSIIAVIGTLVPNTFSLIATDQLPAGIMAIIIATVPMMSLVVALLARIETFSWMRTVGVILGVCALLLIAVPEASLPDPSMAPWLLVALIAPLCYAIEGNFVAARAPIKLSPIVTLFGASVVGTIFITPVVWMGGMSVSLAGPWEVSHWALLGSTVGHVAAYSGYLWLLGRAGAVFTSQIGYVVTLSGVIGAMVLLGESYGITVWAAVAMMLFGVALVRPQKSEPSEAPVANERAVAKTSSEVT